MKVSTRFIKIVDYLKTHRETSIKRICSDLELSDRVVRYEIENLNYILDYYHYPIVQKMPKGKLNFFYKDQMDQIFKTCNQLQFLSKEERLGYLTFRIIMNGFVNITQETVYLGLSRTTVTSDLHEVYRLLSSEKITVKNNRIQSTDERNLRRFIFKRFFQTFINVHHSESCECGLEEQEVKKLININKVDVIKSFINTVLIDSQKDNSKFYDLLFAYVMIVCIRIQGGFCIYDSFDYYIKQTKEYKLICDNKFILEQGFKINLDDDELISLTNMVLGISSSSLNADGLNDFLQLKMIINTMISCVGDELKLNLIYDEFLFNGLFNHMKAAIYRLKNRFLITNNVYLEIMDEHKEIEKTIKKHIVPLEIFLDEPLPEVEIALITIHFMGAIQRNQSAQDKTKNVIVVCGSGYGTAVLLKDLLETNYDVVVKDNISYVQLFKYNLAGIDAIISTIEIGKNNSETKKIPIVTLSAFFSKESETILKNYNINKKVYSNPAVKDIITVLKKHATIQNESVLELELKKLFKLPVVCSDKDCDTLFDFLSYEYVRVFDKIKSWKSAINICGNLLIQNDHINRAYVDAIFQSVKQYGSYFVIRNEIAILHGPITDNISFPCISLLYVKNGVIFPEINVKLVIMIAAKNKQLLMDTVKKINNISQNPNLYEEISNLSKDELVKYFKEEKQ